MLDDCHGFTSTDIVTGTTNSGLKIPTFIATGIKGSVTLKKEGTLWDLNPRPYTSHIASLPPHLHNAHDSNWDAILLN
jgi:hypothetical protein